MKKHFKAIEKYKLILLEKEKKLAIEQKQLAYTIKNGMTGSYHIATVNVEVLKAEIILIKDFLTIENNNNE